MLSVYTHNLAVKEAKRIVLIAVLLCLFLLPVVAGAAMRSSSYIIYENINHAFDGPVISGISASVTGAQVTVTWDTDVIADQFIIYDTDSGFSDSHEQGSSVKSSTTHTVILTGLSENTLYYYQVKSTRINGGTTIDSTVRTATSGSAAGPGGGEEEEPPSGGGGGILIIDKTDKIAPEISDLSINTISFNSVEIVWQTDEPATSFVEYGLSISYGATFGEWSSTTEHSVTLINLQAEVQYHFRALSSDDWGNLGKSDDYVFNTTTGLIEEGEEEEIEPVAEEETGDLTEATQRALDFVGKLFPELSLNDFGEIENIDDLENFMPAPVLSGEPRVEIGPNEAVVYWTTDIEANSQVALAPDSKYSPQANEPYQQVVGDFENYTINHEVRLFGLIPDTNYHFQLRSKPLIGPTARSSDYTFQTSIEVLEITSFFVQVDDNETAVFKWITNKESDSAVKFAPYHNNVIAVDQQKIIKANAFTVIHEVEVTEFIAGTVYAVELISADNKNNVATEIIPSFSTSEDDYPPDVTHIKAESTIFVDRSNKIQTIISWLTNEPSTSRVYFQEGVHGGDVDLKEKSELNMNYTKEHVMVITKFKPGIVYSFRVESIDSGGNATFSNAHTFMTAKKQESIIQIIMRIFEDTFGWIKKLM